MSKETWAAVDDYLSRRLAPHDEALESALRDAQTAGLPSIQVSAMQGKLLHVLALTLGARRILELGTLGGYSTIWLARALPDDGRMISLELEARHAEVARANIARAGLGGKVEVRVGRALDLLTKLANEPSGPFDLVFIDADKPSIPEYFRRALGLTRPGGLILVDNAIRGGALADESKQDAGVQALRETFELITREARVTATAIQTVGSKGYDGLILARVG